jgi:hypothetical protein
VSIPPVATEMALRINKNPASKPSPVLGLWDTFLCVAVAGPAPPLSPPGTGVGRRNVVAALAISAVLCRWPPLKSGVVRGRADPTGTGDACPTPGKLIGRV